MDAQRDVGVEGPDLLGRTSEVAAVASGLRRGPVVVEGEAGIGKTRLLQALRAGVDPSEVVVVVGLEGTSDLAFGSLVPVLGGLPPGDPAQCLAAAVAELVGSGRRRRTILVDDGQWLDRRSAAVVRLAADRAHVVVAVRAGEAVPADLASLRTAGTTVALGPLGPEAISALAREVLGHDLHPASRVELAELSRGNPLWARELLLAARGRGRAPSRGEGERLAFDAVPSTLRGLLDQRISTCTSAGRAVVQLAAIAHGVPVAAALDLHTAAAVDDAERSGLLVGGSGDAPLQVAHPLVAQAVREGVAPARRRALLAGLVEWALAPSTRPWPMCDDRQLAAWALDADAAVPAEVLLAGLRAAVDQRDDGLSLRLARALLASDAPLRRGAVLLCARALHFADRSAEALDLLEQRADERPGGPVSAERAAVEAEIRFWGRSDLAGAREVVVRAQREVDDPAGWAALEAARLTYALLGGEPEVVVAGLTGVSLPPPMSYTVASILVPALVLVGRGAEALDVAMQALEVAPDDAAAATERTMAEAASAFAATEAGEARLAEELGQRALRRGLDLAAEPLQLWASLMLGRAALAGGRLADADRWFAQVAETPWEDRQGPGVRWGLAGRLVVASLGRDRDGALRLLEAIEDVGAGARLMMEPEVATACAHGAEVVGRDPDPHLAAARAAVDRSGASGLAASVELAAAALGRPSLAIATPEGSSPLLVHRCEATRVIAVGGPVDPALIEALASCGAPVDAAVLAAHAHRRGAGRRSVAREAVRRRRSVPEVRLPLLAALDRPELTPREHEIVRLTAEGRTTAEVARVAGCSVRTVENHLHRAYQKLGISGRADLAEALAGS